jgi:hypothetical protein
VSEDPPGVEETPDERPQVVVSINRLRYAVRDVEMMGAALRRLAHPPIPPEDDLFLQSETGSDRRVGDDDVIELSHRTTLYTVPRSIVAGGQARRLVGLTRRTMPHLDS